MRQIRNIPYAQEQTLDVYLPESDSFSALIYFHGGGLAAGDKSSAAEFADALTARGIALVSANYRMYPTARYPDFIEDAAAAVAWALAHMKEYGECSHYFVGGSSAGGYLSMMLCFDSAYLTAQGVDPGRIAGYLHDAGQPTCHFNILRERGVDPRRVIVDAAAPLYHVGTHTTYPPMRFLVSDHDMENRLEQTRLMQSTLKHFGVLPENAEVIVLPGGHCHYLHSHAPGKPSEFGLLAAEFVESILARNK